jgi:hypothetical protein
LLLPSVSVIPVARLVAWYVYHVTDIFGGAHDALGIGRQRIIRERK